MSFSPAQYEQLIKKIEKSLRTAASDADTAIKTIASAAVHTNAAEAAAIDALLTKFASTMNEFDAKVTDFLGQQAFPLIMWQWGNDYIQMAGVAGSSASTLTDLSQYQSEWEGIAGGKYTWAVSKQEPAVGQIQSMANDMQSGCTGTAAAGFTFYLAVAAAAGSLIGGILAALPGAAAAPETAGAGLLESAAALLQAAGIAVMALTIAMTALVINLKVQGYDFQHVSETSGNFPTPLGGSQEQWPRSVS